MINRHHNNREVVAWGGQHGVLRYHRRRVARRILQRGFATARAHAQVNGVATDDLRLGYLSGHRDGLRAQLLERFTQQLIKGEVPGASADRLHSLISFGCWEAEVAQRGPQVVEHLAL